MNTIHKIYLLVFAILLPLQIAKAQTINSINNSSLQKAKELQSKLSFNETILKEIQQAYVEYNGKLSSLKSLNESKSGNKFGNKKYLLKIKLQKTIKTIFNNDESLFDRYLSATRQKDYTKLLERKKRSRTVHLIDRNPSSSRISKRARSMPSRTVVLREH